MATDSHWDFAPTTGELHIDMDAHAATVLEGHVHQGGAAAASAFGTANANAVSALAAGAGAGALGRDRAARGTGPGAALPAGARASTDGGLVRVLEANLARGKGVRAGIPCPHHSLPIKAPVLFD